MLEDPEDISIKQSGCAFGCGLECKYNYGKASTNEKINIGCINYYACSTDGMCIEYSDPVASRCPVVFENDSTCNDNACSKDKEIRCHDNRGKMD